MAARASFLIGRQRITAGVRGSEAGATRDARAAMAIVAKNLKNFVKNLENASMPALAYALEPIYDTSQELVPVDTGALKRSGYIDVRRTARGITAEVGYGKAGRPHYTAFVHENLAVYHKPPTQAKFLEVAVHQHTYNVEHRYAQYLRRSTGLGS